METIKVNGEREYNGNDNYIGGKDDNYEQNIAQNYYLKPISEDSLDNQEQENIALVENKDIENGIEKKEEKEDITNTVSITTKKEHYYRTEIEYFQNKMDFNTAISEITFKPPPFSTLNDHELSLHSRPVNQVSWNNEGSLFASCSQDRSIVLWEQDNLSGMKTYKELKHQSCVNFIHWNPINNNQLASLAGDNMLVIWNAQSGEKMKEIKIPIDAIDLIWSPNGKSIAIASRDGKLVFINVENKTIEKITNFNFNISKILWNNNGNHFLIGTTKSSILFHSYPSMEQKYDLEASRSPITHFIMDPYGKYLAVGGSDGRVSIWNLESMLCKCTLFLSNLRVCSLSFSHCGAVLACGSQTGVLKIVDVINVQELPTNKYIRPCRTVAWHPKKYILGFAEMDLEKDSSTGELRNKFAHRLFVLGA